MSNTHPDWADDPKIGIDGGATDPDSRALLGGLAFLFWPGGAFLIVLVVATIVFDLAWLEGFARFYLALWVVAHLTLRPKPFLTALGLLWSAVRSIFAAGSAFLAHMGGAALMRSLNRLYHEGKAARAQRERAEDLVAVRPVMMMASAVEPEVQAPPESLPPAPKHKRPSWVLAFLRKHWIVVLAVGAGLLVVLGFWKPFGWMGSSPDEVAADFDANIAESQTETARAETDLTGEIGANAEERTRAEIVIARDAEVTRDAIQAAPDHASRVAEHAALVGRMRDRRADATAAALQRYAASVDDGAG